MASSVAGQASPWSSGCAGSNATAASTRWSSSSRPWPAFFQSTMSPLGGRPGRSTILTEAATGNRALATVRAWSRPGVSWSGQNDDLPPLEVRGYFLPHCPRPWDCRWRSSPQPTSSRTFCSPLDAEDGLGPQEFGSQTDKVHALDTVDAPAVGVQRRPPDGLAASLGPRSGPRQKEPALRILIAEGGDEILLPDGRSGRSSARVASW